MPVPRVLSIPTVVGWSRPGAWARCAIACLVLGAGCARVHSGAGEGRLDGDTGSRDEPALTERGGGNGVDVAVWVLGVGDVDAVINAAAKVTQTGDSGRRAQTSPGGEEATASRQPNVLDGPSMARWKANGLRLALVPLSELRGLRTRLGVVREGSQQRFAFSAAPMELVRSGTFQGPVAVQLDSGVFTLEGGAMRLLLRSWPVPAPHELDARRPAASLPPAAVHVELMPQAVRTDGRVSEGWRALGGTSGTDAHKALTRAMLSDEGQGTAFARLTLDATLDGSHALLIVHEPGPTVEDDPGDVQTVAASAPMAPAKGPELPAVPTLGEVLLTDALAPKPRGQRVLLVIVPRPPQFYTLLGR